jgi:hypothetical protein
MPILDSYTRTDTLKDEYLNGEMDKGVYILSKYGWDEKRSSNM